MGLVCYNSQLELKNVEEALGDKILDYYILGRVKFANNDVWYLVPMPKDKYIMDFQEQTR